MGTADDEIASRGVHILVVEDEPVIRAMLADALREAGFVVFEAATADEALILVNGMARLDLLFTDIRMPGSMDGIAAARLIRQGDPHLPVIIASAHLDGRDIADLGPFLAKPYRLNHAIALVLSQLKIGPRGLSWASP